MRSRKSGPMIRRAGPPWTVLVCLLAWPPATASPADVVLQYYESRHATIERRMPDVFMAGYTMLWIPPPGRADLGDFSVGYDVFNRFDLGNGYANTLYGTEATLAQLGQAAERAGVLLFADLVLNHNGFRDASTPGFVDAGDYPGFVTTLPDDVDGDFHGRFESGDWNMRLAGLIDIAQEKNHVFIRQPVTPGDPLNIPNEPASEFNRRFYPDTDFDSPDWLGDTSGDRHSPSGFNLDQPLAGDPVAENATGLLLRHVRWMHEVVGVDGFRLDAAKHIPTWFFNDFYDAALFATGPGGTTPFSFAEVFDGNFTVLSSYTRKDGFGNRDVKDFPLFFTMQSVLNGTGLGDMRLLEFGSFDGSDGDANDGSRGVQFVQSHDSGPPASDNIAHAHILTRTGLPIVYFNAEEFGPDRDFPLDGRGDALGGQFGDLITRLLDIRHERARGPHRTRWVDSDVYVYERENALLVGLNDNNLFAANRTVDTAFRNVTLVELTGNPGASATVTIGADGRAALTIPANGGSLGYAMWSLPAPRGAAPNPFTVAPVAFTIPPDPVSVPNGVRRLTPLEVVRGDAVTLTLRIEPEGLDDNAIVRINNGTVDVIGTGLFADGEFAGYQLFSAASPSFSGGTGVYSATLDLTQLPEGPNYIEALAFLHRSPSTLPPIFETFRKVIVVDRRGPEVALLYPSQTGDGDIQSTQYEVVLANPDATANSVHVLPDFQGSDAQAIAAVNGSNRAQWFDRTEFRFNWTDITDGPHTLVVVAFEETGNVSVTRFDNIDAALAPPPDPCPDGVTTYDQTDYGTDPLGEQFVSDFFAGNAGYLARANDVLGTTFAGPEMGLFLVGPVGGDEPDGGLLPAPDSADALEAQMFTLLFNTQIPPSFGPLRFTDRLNAAPVEDVVFTGGGSYSLVTRTPPSHPALGPLAAAGTTVLDCLQLAATAVQLTGGNETPGQSGTLNGVPITVGELTEILSIINGSYGGGVPTGAVIRP